MISPSSQRVLHVAPESLTNTLSPTLNFDSLVGGCSSKFSFLFSFHLYLKIIFAGHDSWSSPLFGAALYQNTASSGCIFALADILLIVR